MKDQDSDPAGPADSPAARLLERVAGGLSARHSDRLRLGIEAVRRRLFGPLRIYAEDAELRYGTWGAATACLDAAGRRLGEEFGLPRGVHELPNTTWRTWQRPGTRKGLPYNSTALREVAGAWRGLLADLDALRGVYQRQNGCGGGLADAYYLARIGTSLPPFLYRRDRDPIRDGELPSRLAALFKVCAGVHMSIEHMLAHGDREALARTASPAPFYAYVEREKLFVAATGRVCAGPRSMVEELLGHLFATEASPAAADAPLLAEVGDLDPIVRYGSVAARIELAVQLFGFARLRTLAPCLAGSESGDGRFRAALSLAWPPDAHDASRLEAAIELASGLFDHLPSISGVSAGDFVAGKPTPELEALLAQHLESQGVETPGLAGVIAGYLALEASAQRGFGALLRAAQGELDRQPVSPASLSATDTRLSRGATPCDTRDALGVLGLAVGQGEHGLELHLPGGRFRL